MRSIGNANEQVHRKGYGLIKDYERESLLEDLGAKSMLANGLMTFCPAHV